MIDVTALGDAELDEFYAEAHRKTKVRATLTQGAQEMSVAAAEIVSRISGLRGILNGIRGSASFPKYDAIVGHSQVENARSSVVENVGSVAGGIGDVIGKLVGPAVPFLVAGALLVALWKFKGKE